MAKGPSRSKISGADGHAARLELIERAYAAPLQLRRLFAARQDPNDPAPVLARLVGSGRGADVRLGLYLSMLLLGRGGRHGLQVPARAWAAILDLDRPDTAGARQVRSASAWLAKARLIRLDNQSGVPSSVTLLEETGSGRPYQVPGKAARTSKDAKRPVDPRHIYVHLPTTFWTQDWIVGLSVPAVAVLIALLVEAGPSSTDALALPEGTAESRYALRVDTLRRGIRELQDQGVVERTGRRVGTNLDFHRRHNIYRLDSSRLGEPPTRLPSVTSSSRTS